MVWLSSLVMMYTPKLVSSAATLNPMGRGVTVGSVMILDYWHEGGSQCLVQGLSSPDGN